MNSYHQKQKEVFYVVIDGFKNRPEALKFQKVLLKHGVKSVLKKLSKKHHLFRWTKHPAVQEATVTEAYHQLGRAIHNPEILLKEDIHMPTAPDIHHNRPMFLSLREAILLSLRFNPQLQSAELSRIEQRYQLRQAQWNFEPQYTLDGSANVSWSKSAGVIAPVSETYTLTPQVSLNTRTGGNIQLSAPLNSDGDVYNSQVVLGFTQPLIRGAGPTIAELTLRDALDGEILNKLSLQQTTIGQVAQVVQSYRQVIQANNSLMITKQSLKEAEKTLWINKMKIEAGELEPKGNIQQAFQVANIRVEVRSGENAVLQATQNLLQTIGLDPRMRVTVPNDVDVGRLLVPNLDKTIDYALKHNVDYLSALIRYRQTKRQYVNALNQQLWELNLTAQTTYGTTGGTGLESGFQAVTNGRNHTKQVGLSLSVPLNDIPRRSQLISAKLALEQARIALLQQKRNLKTTIINAIINIRTQVNLYHMNVKSLALAEESYQVELKKQAVGNASPLDVTNTQNQLISARNAVTSAKISYLDQMTALRQILATTLDFWKIKLRFA